MYTQVGDFCVSRGPPTVPLTWISRNAVFLKSQNPRNAGTLCKKKYLKPPFYQAHNTTSGPICTLLSSFWRWSSQFFFSPVVLSSLQSDLVNFDKIPSKNKNWSSKIVFILKWFHFAIFVQVVWVWVIFESVCWILMKLVITIISVNLLL